LPGFIGVASDLVSYNDKYTNIIENQLGNVLVVDTIDDLFSISKVVDYKYKMVSLDGEITYPGGSIAGGINKDLLNELVKWWGKHKNKFDLDMIMEDPTFYKYKDSKDGEEGENDSTDDVVEVNELMDSIITALEDRYKEDPSKLTDDMMANIVAWIGINFPNNIEPLRRFMTKLVGNKNALWNGIYGVKSLKTQYMLRAAYPEKGLEEEVEKREHLTLEDGKLSNHCWPEGSLEELKKLMKKYFPWRIKDDKIVPITK
jgi:hypothetical protein